MEIVRNDIIGTGLIGEVKRAGSYPDTALVAEVKALMKEYKVNYMWFAWEHFEQGVNNDSTI